MDGCAVLCIAASAVPQPGNLKSALSGLSRSSFLTLILAGEDKAPRAKVDARREMVRSEELAREPGKGRGLPPLRGRVMLA